MSRIQWRWVVLALIPGLLSDLIFVSLVLLSLNQGNNSDTVAMIATGALWAVLFVPLPTPIYLYFVGRSYVRAEHAGLKSAIPFAILYSLANLVLWACGAAFVGSQMHTPG